MSKKYKILLSAYACEPNRGSEPGVGWNWAIEIAKRGHEVWVLTRANNKNVIEEYWANNPKPNNLHFLYYDLPKSLSFWKRNGHGIHLYYFLWQIAIYLKFRKSIVEKNYDFIHHITFVTIHQPSFLFLIKNIPFFYGPAAGGDVIPFKLLKSFPLKQKSKEIFRNIQCHLLKIDPIRLWMFKKTKISFYNSKSTGLFIPKNTNRNSFLNLAIGVNKTEVTIDLDFDAIFCNLNVVYVGNFQYLKGLHFLLNAYEDARVKQLSKLTLIGKNVELFEIKSEYIEHIEWLTQQLLFDKYKQFDIMIFPSLRDSGGMVVLEAMSNGVPVICLDLGGPGQIVDESCGRVISTQNKTEDEIVNAIVSAISELTSNPELLIKLKYGAIEKAKYFSWKNTVGSVYEKIENYMDTYVKN